MNIIRPLPQRENLIEWLDLFGILQYSQPIKIYHENDCEALYEGLLKDITYDDLLLLEYFKFSRLIKTDGKNLVIYCNNNV